MIQDNRDPSRYLREIQDQITINDVHLPQDERLPEGWIHECDAPQFRLIARAAIRWEQLKQACQPSLNDDALIYLALHALMIAKADLEDSLELTTSTIRVHTHLFELEDVALNDVEPEPEKPSREPNALKNRVARRKQNMPQPASENCSSATRQDEPHSQ